MSKMKDLLKKPDFSALKQRIENGESLVQPHVDRIREKIESRPDIDFVEKQVEKLHAKTHMPELLAVSDALKENRSLLGAFIQAQLRLTIPWMILWFGVLGFLLLLNIFIRPEHPHFVVDAYWGFWAVFGLGVGCLMVFVMKRIVQPLIVRKEDYYGDI